VSAQEATSGGGAPTTRDINATGDAISNLVDAGGTSLNSVFDGGELLIDQDLASSSVASFAIKSGNGNAQLNVASGETHSVGSKFTDNGGDAGVLEKVGAGTLVLTNTANDYTGGTVVSAGTLEISSDSALGASSGGLTLSGGALATTADMSSARSVLLGAGNGVVDTAAATELTLSGVVSGTGSLTKTGAGVLTVTGTNTYTGGTTVSVGTLDLDGSLSSSVTVSSVGRIEGVGSTSGGLVSSGTVAPGNSPGTLSVTGPVVFNSTNNFLVELDGLTYDANGGAGTYDRLAITGSNSSDTFTAGGTLTPVLRGISTPANNNLDPVIGDTFRVVTTGYATAVSGAFSSIADPDYTDAASGMPTNTRFDVLYGGNYVDLVLTPDDLNTFSQGYGIQNMVNAADALDTVRPAQGTNGTTDKDQFFNGLYGLTASQVAQALLQASGEIHAFALSDARDGWQSGVGVVRSASQDADRNYWLDVSGYDLSFDEDSIASSYDGVARRLWIGTDVQQTETYALGVAVGASNSDITTAATGSAEVNTTSLALYMNGSQGAFEYDGILSVNRSKIDTTRTVDLRTGALTNTSSSTARGAALSAQVGYRYEIDNSDLSSLVWLRGDLDTTKADSFVEEGSTVTALTVDEQTMRSTDISLGYTLSGEIKNGDQEGGTWSLGLGASKTINSGMPYATRTISLHDATWDVSVPQSGDITRFASAGIDLPIGDDANLWLNVAASKREGSLAKSAAFGFQVEW
jgi:autotransporter-associated beta strand protein